MTQAGASTLESACTHATFCHAMLRVVTTGNQLVMKGSAVRVRASAYPDLQGVLCDGNSADRYPGTKRVHLWTPSHVVTWSLSPHALCGRLQVSSRPGECPASRLGRPGSARAVTRVPAFPSTFCEDPLTRFTANGSSPRLPDGQPSRRTLRRTGRRLKYTPALPPFGLEPAGNSLLHAMGRTSS